MIYAIVLTPLILGLLTCVMRQESTRRGVLVGTALVHVGLAAMCWMTPVSPVLRGWLSLDDLGRLFLSVTSVLFLLTAFYSIGYLRHRKHADGVYVPCMLFFLAAMTMVSVSGHLGLLWIAIEATTLASAPLICLNRNARSLEAMWKYLLICSVGIALALLGNFCFAAASIENPLPMVLNELMGGATTLQPAWLKAGFLCLLVGYGTKMGLAPLHSWLPDAHSESPSSVSALLSGALLNCAFLGILRSLQVCDAAGLGEFGRKLLLGFGLLSMFIAAIFILHQVDYKRLLAYSSVEHMGILAVGVGLGGLGGFGAMYHVVNHSLTKAMLFLVAGNILAAYRTKATATVQGVVSAMPLSGILWIVGLLAITGSPPFSPFMSELIILRSALEQSRFVVAAVYLGLLAVIFMGMSQLILRMAQGPGPKDLEPGAETSWTIIPPVLLGLAILVLGIWLPPFLADLLHSAAAIVGGTP